MPNETTERMPTSIKDIKTTTLLELSGWTEDKPFMAELRRPSMMKLLHGGKIPNTLISVAQSLFEGKADVSNADVMQDINPILTLICEATLAKPSYQELVDAEIELTDNQMMEIYQFAIGGVAGLERFRTIRAHFERIGNEQALPQQAQRDIGHRGFIYRFLSRRGVLFHPGANGAKEKAPV